MSKTTSNNENKIYLKFNEYFYDRLVMVKEKKGKISYNPRY